MSLRDLVQQAMAPAPRSLTKGRFRMAGLGIMLTGVATVYATMQPAAGSGMWWLVLAAIGVLVLLALPLGNWSPLWKALIFTLAGDTLATAALWGYPRHSGFGVMFVLITAMVSLYHGGVVLMHLAVVGIAMYVHVRLGGDAEVALLAGLAAFCLVVFLRVLMVALRDHITRTETMQALVEMIPVLKAHGVQEVVQAAVHHLVKATTSESGIVMMLDRVRQVLHPYYLHFQYAVAPEEEEALGSFELAVGDGLAGWVALHSQPLISGDAERDPRGRHVPGTETVDESLMIVPLMTNGELYGILRLQRAGLNQYRPEDLKLLELMAAHVSDALSRAALEERMARTDALTGVYNRHFLNEWSHALKPTSQEISVLMVDCRGFKQINDRWGHLVGDQILQAAATLLQESVRGVDLVVRYGGDEFLVVLKGANPDDAEKVSQRLVERVRDWNNDQPTGGPTLALDVGVDSATQAEWQQLLARADVRMYASKRAG